MTTAVRPEHSSSRSTSLNGILRPSQHPVLVVAIAVLGALLVTVVGLVLRAHPIDVALSRALNGLHAGVIGAAASFAYKALEPVPAIVITVLFTGVIWLKTRRLPVAAAFAGLVAFAWLPSAVVKEIVHRARPDAHLLPHPFTPLQVDPSYPSGHVVFVTTFAVALWFLLRDSRWMPLAVTTGVIAIAAMALVVAIDAVHYPTDALASIFWAVTVTPGARVVWVDWIMPRIPFLRP